MEKCCEFELNRKIVQKGEEYINAVLSDIGRSVTSLKFACACKFNNNFPCNNLMNWIDSKNLKSLHIDDITVECQNGMLLHDFTNVETLTLKICFEKWKKNFAKNFLQQFRKLKHFAVSSVDIGRPEWEMVLKNNPDIERLFVRRVDCNFYCKSLEFIPKVQILLLNTFDWYLRDVDALRALHQIKKLHLNCEKENLSDLIGELGKNGIMEELVLDNLKVDDKFFEILKTFDRLQLLCIEYGDGDGDEYDPKNWKLTTAFTCLPRLKYLKLQSFEFTLKTFISTIRQLKCLEKFDLSGCSIARRDKSTFEDLDKLSGNVLESIVDTNRQQRLDVVLPDQLKFGKNHSEVKLAILHYQPFL